MLTILADISQHQQAQPGQTLHWHFLNGAQLKQAMPFWDDLDIQRISQQLRETGLILLRSAPFTQSQRIEFAFNEQNQGAPATNPSATPAARTVHNSATLIGANWQPDKETIMNLAQLNIPEHFAREQTPEFVRYWRESGQSQRSWGSKFIQHIKRQWAYHTRDIARQNRATALPENWQPSQDLQNQMAGEGIPVAFGQSVLKKFKLYHKQSGITHLNWDMPFFSWVKESWQKQDTPFIETPQGAAMHDGWQPDNHTLNYLNVSYGIDRDFIQECIPEFIHKWIEKKAVHSQWGQTFAEHVIEQWRFVQEGVNRNRVKKLINRQWRPSADCLEIVRVQLDIDPNFIEKTIPEFILYWTNRGEPMHSWDNIFLRHIKHVWAAHLKGNNNERQQTPTGSNRTKDRTIAEQLNDRSWAN